MHIERNVDIDAGPDRVWDVMIDVERWPEWTASVNQVELLQPGPLVVGSEARIAQPRLGTRTWRVTELDAGRAFTWEARGTGAHMVATHEVAARDDGSTVTLTVDSSGWAVTLFGWLLAGTGRRFVEMEAAGLKQRCEASAGTN